jgi:hypothetical protein
MKHLEHALATCVWNTRNIQICNIILKQLKHLKHAVATSRSKKTADVGKQMKHFEQTLAICLWNTCNICKMCNILRSTFAISRWNNCNIHLKHGCPWLGLGSPEAPRHVCPSEHGPWQGSAARPTAMGDIRTVRKRATQVTAMEVSGAGSEGARRSRQLGEGVTPLVLLAYLAHD